MSDAARDLIAFIDASPTPYHAVAEATRRLGAAGYERIDETALWTLEPGDRRYVARGDGSLVAFEVGDQPPAEAGFRIVGAHTDSPNLRVKPVADVSVHGYRQLAVEPYGGVLLHTWLDRDLGLAGRVILRSDAGLETVLVDIRRPILRIPALAIHLHREVRTKGLDLNEQKHVVPVAGLEDAPALAELLVTELRAAGHSVSGPEAIQGFELMTADTQPSQIAGSRGEFVFAPRLDNLASCHAGLVALLGSRSEPATAHTRVLVLYDHEEVGSESAVGAGGTLLTDGLARIVAATKGESEQGLARASARSLCVSADMAHAVHPNYADKHEPGHRPVIGGGPVIKVNAGQSYASDATTVGMFSSLCGDCGVAPQHFVTRSDLRCGSTIGPISSARSGISTIDVGNPMLSMHSCREMAGSADVAPMIDVLRAFYEAPALG